MNLTDIITSDDINLDDVDPTEIIRLVISDN